MSIHSKNITYVTGVSTYNVKGNDDVLNVDTSAGPVTIVLPNIVNTGLDQVPKTININDFRGYCSKNNITIIAADNQVNTGPPVVLNQNFASAECLINGRTQWQVNTESSNTSGGGTDTEETNNSFTGTVFTLTHTPLFIYGVFVNGQRLTLGTDYTVLGAAITFVVAKSSDIVTVSYKY